MKRQLRGLFLCLNICKKYGCYVWAAAVIAVFAMAAVFTAQPASATENTTEAAKEDEAGVCRLEYYYSNVCASCHPEEDFYAIAAEQISDLKEDYPYEIYAYNTFHIEDKERFLARVDELGLSAEEVSLPVLVIGEQYLSGLEDIESGIRPAFEAFAKEAAAGETADNSLPENTDEAERVTAANWEQRLYEVLSEDTEDDSVLLFFSTLSCDDCVRAKEYLDSLGETVTLADGSRSRLKIHEFNIIEEDYVVLLQELFVKYGVPSSEQQAPIVFFRGGYLSGADAIMKGLGERLEAGQLQDFQSVSFIAGGTYQTKEKPFGSPAAYASLALTGLINGINPCGASMLLMLLAAAAVSGASVIKTGLAYLAGKFAAYCAMGMGLYQIFLSVGQELLLGVSRTLSWIFAAVFFILAVLYLIDYINVKKQRYGKIRMQLPGWLRKWNHERIESATKKNGKWLLPAVAVLGVVISAGEFFCTGQVYLAAIIYLMKIQQEQKIGTIAAFAIYVSAMCVPSLLITIVLEKTRNVIRMSNAAVAWLPVIKLATAAIFLFFAVFLLLS